MSAGAELPPRNNPNDEKTSCHRRHRASHANEPNGNSVKIGAQLCGSNRGKTCGDELLLDIEQETDGWGRVLEPANAEMSIVGANLSEYDQRSRKHHYTTTEHRQRYDIRVAVLQPENRQAEHQTPIAVARRTVRYHHKPSMQFCQLS